MPDVKDNLDRIIRKHETEERNPEIAKQHLALAEEALKKEDYAKAAEHFHIAFTHDPQRGYRLKELNSLYEAWFTGEGFDPHSGDGQNRKTTEELYKDATLLVNNTLSTLDDIAEFSGEKVKEVEWSNTGKVGIFLSAIINKVIKPDETVTLKATEFCGFYGSFLERGTVIIEPVYWVKSLSGEKFWGEIRDVGYAMRGGRVIAKAIGEGRYSDYGNRMENGELIIERAAGGGFSNMTYGHGVIKSFFSYFVGVDESIGSNQSGGLIEIQNDVPYSIKHLSQDQTGGELRANKDVACRYIGYGKKGGKLIVSGNVFEWQSGIGELMTGGEIIIEGNAGEKERELLVGFKQKGGSIVVKGDVHGSVGSDTWPDSRIEVEGNVYGNVGGYETAGVNILVGKDVYGDVGKFSWDMNCKIRGSVYGDVAFAFGHERAKDRKRYSEIEISGDVHGIVGKYMYPKSEVTVHGNVNETGELRGGTVYVGGEIGNIRYSTCGRVYQGARDVTRINPIARIFGVKAVLGKAFFGE